MRQIRLGLDGEISVGQMLDRLRADGYEVFHDLRGDGFNVDHVLIGPAGVFVIETKTRSKSVGQSNRVEFDGRQIRVNGLIPDRDPIGQAQAGARWVAGLLDRAVGQRPPIRPVVLFPGWWVEQMPPSADVWVLNPKALSSFLRHEPKRIAPPEICALASVFMNEARSRATATQR